MRSEAVRLWLWLCALSACASASSHQAGDIRDVRVALEQHEDGLGELERRANALSAMWSDVAETYADAVARYRAAEEKYAVATRSRHEEQAEIAAARMTYEQARERWVWVSYLVQAAAAMDAANMDAHHDGGTSEDSVPRAREFSCERGMSTAAYRALLISQGQSLFGMDIDHIVPRALGGADHPLNYQVLTASENRSLGATWDASKCGLAGARSCADAVAVSRGCGAYAGGMPMP